MKSFKKTVSLLLILAVLASGVFLPSSTRAEVDLKETAKVAGEWTKALAYLAAGEVTINGICHAYAWGAEQLDVKKFISNALDKIKNAAVDKVKKWGEKQVDKIKKWGEKQVNKIFGKAKETADKSVGGGGAVPVQDADLKRKVAKEETSTRATTRYEACRTLLREAVLATFKKRLLDRLTDMTIAWIQGKDDEAEPMFVTNPKEFYKQVLNDATGQLIDKLGGESLCYKSQRFRLQYIFTTPTFSEQISCTLDDVIDNITAFRNDFRNGNWIAYQEALKPQNNRWGAEAIAEGEKQKREYEAELMFQYEIGAASGFLSQKRCAEWTLTEDLMGKDEDGNPVLLLPAGEKVTLPAYYTQTPDGVAYTGRVQKPAGSIWRCTNSQTVTPGRVVSEMLAKSIGSEYDFVINADDLTTYGAAILDTIINQLVTKGVKEGEGLFAVKSHKESKQEREEEAAAGSEGGGEETTECDQFDDPELKYLCEISSPNEENLNDTMTNTELNSIGSTLEEASSTLQEASSTLFTAEQNNEELITNLYNLNNCQIAYGISSEERYDPDAGDKYYEAIGRRDVLNEKQESINALESRIITLQEELENVDVDNAEMISSLSEEADNISSDVETLAEGVASLSEEIDNLLIDTNQNIQSLISDYGDVEPGYPECANPTS